MSEYTITIDGHESELSRKTIEQTFREQYGGKNVSVTVTESDSDITVGYYEPYFNIFYDDTLVASLSERWDELLVYQAETEEPLVNHDLSELRDGTSTKRNP